MALVVETTTTATVSNADSVTINKPTGVVEGDLLVLVASGYGTNAPSCSGFTVGVTKTQDNSGIVKDASVSLLYKIAGDSEPSTYTVTLSGANTSGSACMLRISGWTTGNPIYRSSNAGGNHDTASISLGTSGLSLVRPTASLLIQAWCHQGNNAVTMDTYAVTSSGSNPSWTEVTESSFSAGGGIDTITLACAYANDSDVSAITAFSATATSSTSGDPEGYAGIFAVICEPNSPTTDVSQIAVTPTLFAPTVTQVNTAPTISHLDTEPDVFSATARATAPTQWTNEAKPSTTWTNETL